MSHTLRSISLAIFLFAPTIVLSAVSPAWAEDAARAAVGVGAPAYDYVAPSTLPPQLLAPPPEEGSKAWRKETDAVLEMQKNIPTTDLNAMRDEQHLSLDLMTKSIGNNFMPEHFPTTFALLDRVLKNAQSITDTDKKFWHTRRPYLTDHNVMLLVDPIDSSPAYPSGHTSETRVLAEVLGLLYPERLMALRTRAAEIAQHRVEAGVHYPVDILGGENLAMLIVGALMENERFQIDLAAARKEITQPK